jgi:hypothetical protein
VFVSPYMTLVSAYERLIGGRGTEVAEDLVAGAGPSDAAANANRAITLAAVQRAFFAAAGPAAAPRTRHVAVGCGWRQRHWRGCGGAPAAHAPQAAHASAAQAAQPVQGAQIVRHGQAPRTFVVHRVYRRNRT